ncbi:MAG: FeoA family protein [Deltaproteobacteria bacterium]
MESGTEVQLNTMTPGERGVVARINVMGGAARQRLMEMGLIKGTPVELIRVAPMGDPIEVRIRGYRLSLRKLEAESVIVRKAPH